MNDSFQTSKPSRARRRAFPWRCPECRQHSVNRATIPHTAQIKHDGKLHTVVVPELQVPKCDNCGELLFDNDANDQIYGAMRNQLGLLQAEDIRSARKQLGLTQAQLSHELGVAVETISRWETGALVQSRALDRYLQVYFRFKEVRNALRQGIGNTEAPVDASPVISSRRTGQAPRLRIMEVPEEVWAQEVPFTLRRPTGT